MKFLIYSHWLNLESINAAYLKKLTCCIQLLAITFACFSQTARKPVTSLYNNLTAYSVKNADALSFSANQAALANITQWTGGVYGEQRFLLADLGLYHAALAIPTPSGTFGLAASYFGSSFNNELQAGLAYGRKLSDKISVGAGFNYFTVSLASYGAAAAYNFEAGVLLNITEQLHAGVHAYNPTSATLGKAEDEYLPSIYTAGLGYEPSDKLFIAASLQKIENAVPDFNAGVHYRFDQKLGARVGFSSGASTYYMGLGYQLSSFRLDVTATVHPRLGVTPGIQILFQRQEAKN